MIFRSLIAVAALALAGCTTSAKPTAASGDKQLTAFGGALKLLNYRRKCRWHSGNERLAGDFVA